MGTEAQRHEGKDVAENGVIDNRQSAIGNPNLVVLEIRNTGPAIPPEMLPRISEPFQTTKPVRRDGKSRCGGLGLTLVRDLVGENDGTISVASDEIGTTFVITLPREPRQSPPKRGPVAP